MFYWTFQRWLNGRPRCPGDLSSRRSKLCEPRNPTSSFSRSRLMIGDAIKIMCRSPKSRAGCHFVAAIGLRSMFEGYVPAIPDWANDQHTLGGKKLGRGLDHFRSEGAKLIPEPTAADPYEDEAYRLWAIKQRGNGLI